METSMIPYRYLAFGDHPPHSYWDQTFLDDIFKDSRFYEYVGPLEDIDGAIIVIPGAYQGEYIDQINAELGKLKWVILIISSDEESKFPIEKISHSNIEILVQYPKRGRHDEYGKLPIGYTSHTRKELELVEKDLDYFFSGQMNNKRREECFMQLSNMSGGVVFNTGGFAKGMPPKEYMSYMNRAKIVPAPAGGVSADSFRFYEALEAGALPLADNKSDSGDTQFWNYLFGAVPFPEIEDYNVLPGCVHHNLSIYPVQNNRAQAWWIKIKRDIKELERREKTVSKYTIDDTITTVEKFMGFQLNEKTTVKKFTSYLNALIKLNSDAKSNKHK